jgi:hypothetical protein
VGIGWVAKGGNLSNVAVRSAALGGLNGAASGAGEGSSFEEQAGNARNGMIFGTLAGGAAPYVARGLETTVSSAAKVAGPRLRALADQIPAPVSQTSAVPAHAAKPIAFGRVIGEGFERGTLNYGQQTRAVVKLDSQGKAYTAYALYGY